jgi:hypothetical protein
METPRPEPVAADIQPDVFSRSAITDLLRNLFDVQMREIITSRMLPLIYACLLVLDAIGATYLTLSAFLRSLIDGLMWLVAVGPALFLAVMITIRVVLELVMAAFRIAVRVEQMQATTQNIAGSTEVLSDLPRITFWRGLRGKPERDPRA